MQDDKWQLIHKYQRLVSNGEAAAIKCPDCQDEMVVQVGTGDEPVFKCFYCRTVITPGLHVWDQIKKVLNV